MSMPSTEQAFYRAQGDESHIFLPPQRSSGVLLTPPAKRITLKKVLGIAALVLLFFLFALYIWGAFLNRQAGAVVFGG